MIEILFAIFISFAAGYIAGYIHAYKNNISLIIREDIERLYYEIKKLGRITKADRKRILNRLEDILKRL